jgi:hypothetical protein
MVVDGRRRYFSARNGLKRKDSAAREEIEKPRALDAIADDVEERLTGALGRGPDQARRNWNAAAAECAASDAERGHYCSAAPVVPMK